MKLALVAFLFACVTPALAQGVSNSRDAGGNLRDRGIASGNIQQQPMVNRSTNQAQQPIMINRAPPPATVIKPVR
jgi:hypothetical protein